MRAMKTVRGVCVWAVLALVPLGCDRLPEPAPPPPPTPLPPKSLNVGWEPQGLFHATHPETPYESRSFVWQDANRAMCMGVMGIPGRVPKPLYLVIARLPAGWQTSGNGYHSGRGDILAATVSLGFQQPGDVEAEYAIRKEGRGDVMRIAGRDYSPKDGRVFLVDATRKTPAVWQVSAGLDGHFETRGFDASTDEHNFDKLAAALGAFLKADPRAKRFWAGDDPDAEDA